MTAMQEQAIDMIKRLPDDKIYYVVNILQGIEGLYLSEHSKDLSRSQKAYRNLQRFRKVGVEDRDYKNELKEALEEKYANIG